MLLQSCTEETIHKVGLHGSFSGTINGSAPYAGITPLAGATVVLEGTDPLVTLETDSNGKFSIDNLVTGTYNLDISKAGYGTYRLQGYSFVGGDNPTVLYPVTLYKLPTAQIKDASVTVTKGYYGSSAAFTILSDIDDSQQTYGVFRYYLSSDASVSATQYQSTGILGSYYQGGSQTFYWNLPIEKYPAGTTFYVIIYPCTEQYSSYLDLETGMNIFASAGTSKSAVLKVVVPN